MRIQAGLHSPIKRHAQFRFYQELNDFLPGTKRGKNFDYVFSGKPSVKDAIEAMGVPHPEVDLILVDGSSVAFNYPLKGGERVAVYPVFERFDISPLVHLRPQPLRETKFILDVHLGKLARYLRLCGFDCYYRNDLDDPEIIRRAADEKRIILTRDIGILKTRSVTHGYWVRNTAPKLQLKETVETLQLEKALNPFSRCADCNAPLKTAEKEMLQGRIDDAVWQGFREFAECTGCQHIYWKGTHYDRICELINWVIKSD
ncbi:MAG: Mut7-C RNAse domain-containing protein [Pseudomonadales bacterium]